MENDLAKERTPRRAAQFWEAFNQWWRAEFEALGRKKPKTQAIVRWYQQNADGIWGDESPSLKETKRHAKGLRPKTEIREYFRKYRAVRGRSDTKKGRDAKGKASKDGFHTTTRKDGGSFKASASDSEDFELFTPSEYASGASSEDEFQEALTSLVELDARGPAGPDPMVGGDHLSSTSLPAVHQPASPNLFIAASVEEAAAAAAAAIVLQRSSHDTLCQSDVMSGLEPITTGVPAVKTYSAGGWVPEQPGNTNMAAIIPASGMDGGPPGLCLLPPLASQRRADLEQGPCEQRMWRSSQSADGCPSTGSMHAAHHPESDCLPTTITTGQAAIPSAQLSYAQQVGALSRTSWSDASGPPWGPHNGYSLYDSWVHLNHAACHQGHTTPRCSSAESRGEVLDYPQLNCVPGLEQPCSPCRPCRLVTCKECGGVATHLLPSLKARNPRTSGGQERQGSLQCDTQSAFPDPASRAALQGFYAPTAHHSMRVHNGGVETGAVEQGASIPSQTDVCPGATHSMLCVPAATATHSSLLTGMPRRLVMPQAAGGRSYNGHSYWSNMHAPPVSVSAPRLAGRLVSEGALQWRAHLPAAGHDAQWSPAGGTAQAQQPPTRGLAGVSPRRVASCIFARPLSQEPPTALDSHEGFGAELRREFLNPHDPRRPRLQSSCMQTMDFPRVSGHGPAPPNGPVTDLPNAPPARWAVPAHGNGWNVRSQSMHEDLHMYMQDSAAATSCLSYGLRARVTGDSSSQSYKAAPFQLGSTQAMPAGALRVMNGTAYASECQSELHTAEGLPAVPMLEPHQVSRHTTSFAAMSGTKRRPRAPMTAIYNSAGQDVHHTEQALSSLSHSQHGLVDRRTSHASPSMGSASWGSRSAMDCDSGGSASTDRDPSRMLAGLLHVPAGQRDQGPGMSDAHFTQRSASVAGSLSVGVSIYPTSTHSPPEVYAHRPGWDAGGVQGAAALNAGLGAQSGWGSAGAAAPRMLVPMRSPAAGREDACGSYHPDMWSWPGSQARAPQAVEAAMGACGVPSHTPWVVARRPPAYPVSGASMGPAPWTQHAQHVDMSSASLPCRASSLPLWQGSLSHDGCAGRQVPPVRHTAYGAAGNGSWQEVKALVDAEQAAVDSATWQRAIMSHGTTTTGFLG